jgi:hypothetical protein
MARMRGRPLLRDAHTQYVNAWLFHAYSTHGGPLPRPGKPIVLHDGIRQEPDEAITNVIGTWVETVSLSLPSSPYLPLDNEYSFTSSTWPSSSEKRTPEWTTQPLGDGPLELSHPRSEEGLGWLLDFRIRVRVWAHPRGKCVTLRHSGPLNSWNGIQINARQKSASRVVQQFSITSALLG